MPASDLELLDPRIDKTESTVLILDIDGTLAPRTWAFSTAPGQSWSARPSVTASLEP